MSLVDIHMKDGTVHEKVFVDGGGREMFGPNAGRREVHGTREDNGFFCEFEDEIEKAVDPVTQEQVQIGDTV